MARIIIISVNLSVLNVVIIVSQLLINRSIEMLFTVMKILSCRHMNQNK